MKAGLFAAVCALALSGCELGEVPMNVDVRNVSSALLLGKGGTAAAQAPVPPLAVPSPEGGKKPGTEKEKDTTPFGGGDYDSDSSGSGGGSTGGSTGGTTGGSGTNTPPPAGACPTPDTSSPVGAPATDTVTAPPSPETYPVRVEGSLSKGTQKVDFPADGTSTVAGVTPEWPGSFTYQQGMKSGTNVSTTTYRVIPPNSTPPPGLNPAGIYLVGMTTPGAPSYRMPDPGIQLASLPAKPGEKLTARNTDGTRTMSFTSTVTGNVKVPACGKWINAFEVKLTDGKITTPGQEDVTFTATYHFGLQYGGVLLGASQTTTGPDDDKQVVTRTVGIKPNAEPRPAATAVVQPCKAAPTDQVPALLAPDNTTGGRAQSPAAAGYPVRSAGDVTDKDGKGLYALPWNQTWTVAVDGNDGTGLGFRVAQSTGGTPSTTAFRVVPDDGVYLTEVGGYKPLEPMKIAVLPLTAGATLPVTAVDADGKKMAFTAVVGGHTNISTCDTQNIDTWQIELRSGTIAGTDAKVSSNFNTSYFIAPQFGWLPVAQSTTIRPGEATPPTGTTDGVVPAVTGQNYSATLNTLPGAAQ
jgi:hypothetical protein